MMMVGMDDSASSVYVVLYCGRWMALQDAAGPQTTKRILRKELSLSSLFSIISLSFSYSLRFSSLVISSISSFSPIIDKDAAGGGLSILVLSVLVSVCWEHPSSKDSFPHRFDVC